VTVNGSGSADVIGAEEFALLRAAFRKAMTAASGHGLDLALTELGWRDMLAEVPDLAVPLTFRLLGETGAHAPLLNDVVLVASGREPGVTVPLPYAGGSWVTWERDERLSQTLDGLPLRRITAPDGAFDAASGAARALDAAALAAAPTAARAPALAAGRRAVGWWLLGTGRAMLALARTHAVDRVQFGRPIASFQAVRHRLAETLVALDGAEAVLTAAGQDGGADAGGGSDRDAADRELRSLLAKAAAGQAALTAARHCQQVLGGIGFTAEHALHIHVKRALVLDGLLGSTRELTREAGRRLIADGAAPRLIDL
jgi:Acyl-CoA dehydrogenase, C-terminal domain